MDIIKKRWMAPAILVQNSDGELFLKHVTDKNQSGATRIGGIELSGMDKYTAGIELSNACRSYYARRLRTAEGMKKKLSLPPSAVPSSTSPGKTHVAEDVDEGYITQRPTYTARKQTSIDKAMDKLRNELVSDL